MESRSREAYHWDTYALTIIEFYICSWNEKPMTYDMKNEKNKQKQQQQQQRNTPGG